MAVDYDSINLPPTSCSVRSPIPHKRLRWCHGGYNIDVVSGRCICKCSFSCFCYLFCCVRRLLARSGCGCYQGAGGNRIFCSIYTLHTSCPPSLSNHACSSLPFPSFEGLSFENRPSIYKELRTSPQFMQPVVQEQALLNSPESLRK